MLQKKLNNIGNIRVIKNKQKHTLRRIYESRLKLINLFIFIEYKNV